MTPDSAVPVTNPPIKLYVLEQGKEAASPNRAPWAAPSAMPVRATTGRREERKMEGVEMAMSRIGVINMANEKMMKPPRMRIRGGTWSWKWRKEVTETRLQTR